jgi:hypothetical protein
MQPSTGWKRRSVITVLAVCLGVPLLRLYQVHDAGREWRLSPSAAPPRVLLDGRSYLRGRHVASIPPEESAHGRTPGGATIFADNDPRTDTVIFVRAGRLTFDYALQGGP